MNVKPILSPHEKAPLFSRPDAELAFQQVMAEVMSGNFPAQEAFLSIMAQAGLVSLWFFLRCILAYNGPYSQIDTGIHMEVCNFRQGSLRIGARDAVALPRSGLKSTICTHGAMTWELVRDPDIAAGIISFPADRAVEFFKLVKSNFEQNKLLQELYPECTPPTGNGSRWTEKEIVMPARKRMRQDPSLKPITAGGATQGIHLDLANFDDLVGDSMLDSTRHATADMISMTNWFSDNQATMLVHPEKSRIIFPFTRYGLVDPGEDIMLNASVHEGDWYNVESWYPRVDDGQWHVYYRSARGANGQSILPERFSTDFLDRMQRTNPVGYQLNYANDPHIPEAADLSMYSLKEAKLVQHEESGTWLLRFPKDGEEVALSECDIVQAIDPAGGTTKGGASKSMTAQVVMVTLHDRRRVFLEARQDFVKTSKWFDWMYEALHRYPTMRKSAAELQAGFKSLEDIISIEQMRRRESLHFEGVPALGDKDTTIRTYLQPELERGKLYATDAARRIIEPAIKSFPGGRKDILDACKIAVYKSIVPIATNVREQYEEEAALAAMYGGRNPNTGY